MFFNGQLVLRYLCNNLYTDINTSTDFQNEQIKIVFDCTADALKVTIKPLTPIELVRASYQLSYQFKSSERYLCNGYQSWTKCQEVKGDYHERGINHLPKALIRKFGLDRYGDYHFVAYPNKKGFFHSHTYSYIRQEQEYRLFGSLSERNGFTIINYQINDHKIEIVKDIEKRVISTDYLLYDLRMYCGQYDTVFDRYFVDMGINKPLCEPLKGYTSWYNRYQAISEASIREDFNGMCRIASAVDVFQIDDGYETAVGDWQTIDGTKFPHGLVDIVKDIRNAGFIPGLWLAPFVCETKSEIFKKHPDWLLKDAKGDLVYCGCNWSGFYALDFYQPAVREYIKDCFTKVIKEWHFGLLKLDFLYAACMVPRADKTRGEIMCEAMKFLREIAGDALLIGCGVPLAPAFGQVDFCRIGADVSFDFDGPLYMRLIGSERPSTKNGMINALFRRHLDGRAFYNDPDVFFFRKENLKMSHAVKHNLAFINSLCGSLLFTSDDLNKYDDEQLTAIQDTYSRLLNHVIEVTEVAPLTYKITYQDIKEEQFTTTIKLNE